eukprot:GSChrysophyteH1.ASY1.ANO1.1024.1 assembled CDS
MEPVLPVPEVDFASAVSTVMETGDISEMTAEQYMAWVRHEAEDLPPVVRADLDQSKVVEQSKYMPDIECIEPCPEHFQPSNEWVKDVMFSFSELRGVLAQLALDSKYKERCEAVPAMKDKAAWRLFCLGEDSVDGDNSHPPEDDTGRRIVGDKPVEGSTDEIRDAELAATKRRLFALLDAGQGAPTSASASPRTNERLLAAAEEQDSSDSDGGKNTAQEKSGLYPTWTGTKCHPPTTKILLQFDQVLTQRVLQLHCEWLQKGEINEARGQWLYGLLARLEKPLYQDSVAVVRALYRRCCYLRGNLDEDNESFDTDLAALNV